MKRRKRISRTTEITVETREVLVSRHSTHLVTAWCPSCTREVLMDSPEAAARAAGVTTRTVYGWVEAGKVHFTETPGGSLLVCLSSAHSYRHGGTKAGEQPLE